MSNVYHRRKIESNWEKYEEAAVTGNDVPVHAADYGELLKATCMFVCTAVRIHTTDFYSAPQCSHCKHCTSYSNSVCLSHAGIVSKQLQFALSDSKMCLVL